MFVKILVEQCRYGYKKIIIPKTLIHIFTLEFTLEGKTLKDWGNIETTASKIFKKMELVILFPPKKVRVYLGVKYIMIQENVLPWHW